MAVVLLLIAAVAGSTTPDGEKPLEPRAPDNRPVFSPRMDYDEWKPLGRGDPLKNDPTYDYVPPVLDRVHYWMDPSKRTPDPPLPNPEMTVTIPTDMPNAGTTVPASSRLGSMSILDPFLKFMDASKASLGFTTLASNYFRPTPSPTLYSPHRHVSTFYGPSTAPDDYGPPPPPPPQPVQALQRPPYTMLMPPPPPATPSTTTELPLTSFGTSTKTTSEAEETSPAMPATLAFSQSNTDDTTTTIRSVTAAVLTSTMIANSENLYKPVAITMPESISNETNDVLPITTIPLTTQEDPPLPIASMFSETSNHINYNEVKRPNGFMVPQVNQNEDYDFFLPTTVRPRPSTTIRTLTTDPMFKHYKQPSEPVRGPFYLIIQGHSKVKTYGASKNKVKAVSNNEINFEDGKYDGLEYEEKGRRERKLHLEDFVDENDKEDIVEGHPTIELSSTFQAKNESSYVILEPKLEDLEVAFPKTSGGTSKKRILIVDEPRQRKKRFIGRRLLAVTSSPAADKKGSSLDQQQLGLESLIALNDDYNSEDIINLLNKEEGQGSGYGSLIATLLSRSINSKEEI